MNLSLAYNCCMDGLLKLWSWFGDLQRLSIATETQTYVLSWISSWFQISIGLALQHHSWLWRCWAQKFKRDWAGATWSELSLGEVGRTSLKCSTPAPDVDNDKLVWCWWWVVEMKFVDSLKFAWLCWLSAPRTHLQYVFSWCLQNMLACPTTCGSVYHLCTSYCASIYSQTTRVLVPKTSPSFDLLRMWIPISTRTTVSCTAEWPVRHPVVVTTFQGSHEKSMSHFQMSALALWGSNLKSSSHSPSYQEAKGLYPSNECHLSYIFIYKKIHKIQKNKFCPLV